jgi:hypothetical protein
MSGFKSALQIERFAESILLPYMEREWPDCVYYPTRHHALVQKFDGDFLVKRCGKAKYIEFKAEQTWTGNFFLETWSNKNRQTPGWFHTCIADWLWYYFCDKAELYILEPAKLRAWANNDKLLRYREVPQRSYDQQNDTWGRLVPIALLSMQLPGMRGPIDPRTAIRKPAMAGITQ